MKPYEEMTNHELSEAFAVEFLGWVKGETDYPDDLEGSFVWPDFASSVDALLPYLKNVRFRFEQWNENEVWVDLCAPEYGESVDATLPRAICAALLNAKKNKITT